MDDSFSEFVVLLALQAAVGCVGVKHERMNLERGLGVVGVQS